MAVVSRAKIEARTVIRIIVWRRIGRAINDRRRVWRRRLVHVEVNLPRDGVFRGEQMTGPERARLDELVGVEREGLDHVIIGAKIVEGAVRIAKNLQGA